VFSLLTLFEKNLCNIFFCKLKKEPVSLLTKASIKNQTKTPLYGTINTKFHPVLQKIH